MRAIDRCRVRGAVGSLAPTIAADVEFEEVAGGEVPEGVQSILGCAPCQAGCMDGEQLLHVDAYDVLREEAVDVVAPGLCVELVAAARARTGAPSRGPQAAHCLLKRYSKRESACAHERESARERERKGEREYLDFGFRI